MPNWKLATRISIRLAALVGLWCYVASAAAQAPVEQSNTDPNGVDMCLLGNHRVRVVVDLVGCQGARRRGSGRAVRSCNPRSSTPSPVRMLATS